nr:hypothetical protein [Tanacetum cinerariifolium]
MDLLFFIRSADPTKMRIDERQRDEDEPKLLETTVGHVVPLLPVAPDRSSGELEASVEKLFGEGGSDEQAEQGDSASGGHDVGIDVVAETSVEDVALKLRDDYGAPGRPTVGGKSQSSIQRLLAGVVQNAKVRGGVIPILPFVSSFVSTTPEREGRDHTELLAGDNLRAIGAPQRFVISSESSDHSGVNIAEAEVDYVVRTSMPIITIATTTTPTADLAAIAKEELVGSSGFGADSPSAGGSHPIPSGFSNCPCSNFLIGSIRTVIDPDSNIQKFYVPQWNVTNGFCLDDSGVCREMVDEFAPPKFFTYVRGMDHVHLFTKFNVGAARQISLSAEEKDSLLKSMCEEIESLKAQLLVKETEATEAVNLRAEASKFKIVEKSLPDETQVLKEHNSTLEKEKNELEIQVTDLAASVKVREQEVADLDVVVTSVKLHNESLALYNFWPYFVDHSCDPSWSYGFRVVAAVFEMDRDDLYNHLKVYEAEVQKKPNSNPQDMAFISPSKNNNNKDGNTVCVTTATTPFPTGSVNVATISQDTARSKAEEKSSKALMAIDGIGWDWSYMANEEDHALVADGETTVAVTTEDMQKRRNDVKARTTLLLALPDEHQLRFGKYKTAQELWAAILKTFGGNEATKKTKKNQLKHYLAPEWLMYTIVWRNRSDLDTMSLEDLFNHLKVYEPEVQKKSESNSQNMAFISSAKNNSRKEKVNTASFPTTSTQVSPPSANVAAASFSHDTVCAYIASQSNGSQIKYKEINQIDEDDIEEMDIKWNTALLSMRADRFWKKTGKKITIQGTDVARFDKSKGSKTEEQAPKALMSIDEVGWDWSYMANEEVSHALVANLEAPTEFALMAKSSSENEVFDNSLCYKACKKNTDSLNTKITELSEKLSDSKTMLYHYKLGLSQVKARLIEFKNQEIKLCEKIKGLEFNVECKNDRIERLTNELEELKKEKEGLDSKLTGFQSASKDLDTLIGSQRSDKNKEGLGPSPSIESNSNDLQSSNSFVYENRESSSSILSKPVITFVKAADSPT